MTGAEPELPVEGRSFPGTRLQSVWDHRHVTARRGRGLRLIGVKTRQQVALLLSGACIKHACHWFTFYNVYSVNINYVGKIQKKMLANVNYDVRYAAALQLHCLSLLAVS